MLGPVPPRTFKKKTFPGVLLCAAALFGAGSTACSEETGDSADPADGDTQKLALEEQSDDGAGVASITANGSGCPRGNWRAFISSDDTVTVRFNSFEGEVGRSRRVNVKDCNLSIKLNETDSYSYALADLRVDGRAYLRGSANLTVSTNAYWQGNPTENREARLDLRESDSFSLRETLSESERLWSPCGKQRNLNLVTRGRLATSDDSYGWFEISRGELKLAMKRCGDAQPDAGPDANVPDAGPDVPDAGPDASDPDGSVPPTGARVTSVTANGTGCPAGTATPTIAADGRSFTVAFAQFSGSVDENTAIAVKDCNLTVAVSAPAGQTYALQSLNVKGTGALGAGANVNLTTNYYFMGDPAVSAQQATTFTGPYDQAFDVTHAFGDAAPAAPCGLERDIIATLRFRLQNGTPRTNSTFTVGSAGDAAFRLVPCQ